MGVKDLHTDIIEAVMSDLYNTRKHEARVINVSQRSLFFISPAYNFTGLL